MYHDLRQQRNVIRNRCRKFKDFDFQERLLAFKRLPAIRRPRQGRLKVKLFKFLHQSEIPGLCGSIAHSVARVATSCDGNAMILQKSRCHRDRTIACVSVALNLYIVTGCYLTETKPLI